MAASTLFSKVPVMRVALLPPLPIYTRLLIEEALFYKTTDNWFIYGDGPPTGPPCVVLGISGKPERMCNLEAVSRDSIPLLRRFSGGGTVIVDSGTMFTTLIANHADLPHVQPYPREIMEWSRGVFGPAIGALARKSKDGSGAGGDASAAQLELGLRENDYVFGDLKFGGNAQAISRGRWLHHTSFLWSFRPSVMEYLRLPDKRPAYRGDRAHGSFLTPLSAHLPSDARERFAPAVAGALAAAFEVRFNGPAEVDEIVAGLGGARAWAAACRTKFVGADGGAVAAPFELHPHSLTAVA